MFSVKMKIKNLGPIKTADLDIGDITVVFGLPNTGKSYTLKALYSQTLMLDEVARNFEIRKIMTSEITEKSTLLSIADIAYIIFAVVLLYRTKHHLDDNVEKFKKNLKKILNIDFIDLKIKNNSATVILKNIIKIHFDNVLSEMKSFWNLLPRQKNTQVTLEGRLPLPTMFDIIPDDLSERHCIEEESDNEKIFFRIKLCYNINEIITEIEITISNLDEIILDEDRDLEMILKNAIPSLSIDVLFSDEIFYDMYKTYISRMSKSKVSLDEITNYFLKTLGTSFEISYKEALDINSVRYIPFGRSPLVCQLEYISREPIERAEKFKEFVDSFCSSDVLLYSYITWLSRGRLNLIEKINLKSKILNLFRPILQGDLVYEDSFGIAYKSKKCRYNVPVKWASALASEVAGILLPLLTVPPKSMLIIEEPESQLHYSAQVLMALTLLGLSAEFNHKLVFSTHSDVIVLVLAYFAKYKPNKKEIENLVRSMFKIQKIKATKDLLNPVVEAAVKAKNLKVNFYYYELVGRRVVVSKKEASEIIRRIPTFTDVVDEFANWALSLGGKKRG